MSGTESARSRSQQLAEYLHFTGNLNAFQMQVDTINTVRATAARAFAQRYLGRERARAVLIEPVGGAVAPPEPVPLAMRFVEDASYPEIPAVTLDSLAKVRRLTGLRTVTLNSGLQLIILRRPGAAVITSSLGFHGGESSAGPGVASAAFDNLDLNWEASPSAFGIGVSMGVGRELSTMTMSAGARNVPRALDMLSFLVRSYDLEWPSEKFQTVKLPLLRRQDATASSRGRRAFLGALYLGHRYGDDPTPDQIAGIARADLQSWLERTVVPANAALAIVGDIDPVEAEAAARDAFSGWSSSAPPIAAPPPARPRATAQALAQRGRLPWSAVVTHRPGATQSELQLGCLLPPGDARTKAVYEITADLIGSALGHRLREQVGATYGVHADARVLRGGTALLQINSAIDNARLPLAMTTIEHFWKRTAEHDVDADRVRRLRDGQSIERALGFQTSATIAQALLDSWNRGWPLDWLDRAPADLASVQPPEVDTTLRTCAQNLVLSLTGDEQVIRAALASAGQ